nr:structural protein [Tolivirales sp. gcode 6]
MKNVQQMYQAMQALGAIAQKFKQVRPNQIANVFKNPLDNGMQVAIQNRPKNNGNQTQIRRKTRTQMKPRTRQRVSRNNPTDGCVQAPVQLCKPVNFCRGNGKITVTNKELISEIYGSTGTFDADAYQINPGLYSTFKWLASIASNYEFYKIKNLSFEYVPLVGTNTTGYLAMAFDSDVLDEQPGSKQEMSTYNKFQSGSTWNPLSLDVPVGMMNKFVKNHYIRSGPVPANADLKTYDVGQVIIAVGGQNSATQIGELYMCYTVDLEQPCTNSNSAPSALALFTADEAWDGHAFADGNVAAVVGGLPVKIDSNTLIIEQSGYYFIAGQFQSSAAFSAESFVGQLGATFKLIKCLYAGDSKFITFSGVLHITNGEVRQGIKISFTNAGTISAGSNPGSYVCVSCISKIIYDTVEQTW